MENSNTEEVRTEEGDWWTHFFGAAECCYRRTTLVSYLEVKVLVSTVGDWHLFSRKKAVPLDGKNVFFETVASEAQKIGSAWGPIFDKSIAKETICRNPKTFDELNFENDHDLGEIYGDADRMHQRMVSVIENKIKDMKSDEEEIDNEKQKIEEHRRKVAGNINQVIEELKRRAETHDASKLEPPEFEIYKKVTPEFKGKKYGTTEYIKVASKLGPALKHHYEVNRHHPEYFQNGVNGMTLIDVIEMLCDWIASAERSGGTLDFEKNKIRFGLSDQLVYILSNTYMKI